MCAQSPNAYMYAQLVLLNASQLDSAGSARLMRLYWELERLAIAEHPSSRVVPRLGFLLMGVFGGSHRELALGIVAMLEAGESNPADLLKIHRAYSAPNPPPVRFLRNQRLLAMLVDDVFSPTKELAAKWADKYIYCVAYACAVADSGDASMLAPTQQAIEVASRVAKQNLFGPQLEEHMPLLQHYVASFPVVAKGLLHWIRANVCDRAYFEKGTHSLSLARFISLVVDICATQPRQRAECVELLQSAYDTVESAQAQEGLLGEAASVKVGPEKKRPGSHLLTPLCVSQTHLLNALVRTMLVGDGNVVSAILKWTQQLTQRSTTDTAIMRQYVKQLFASVAPPYGAPFVEYVAVMLDYCVPATSDAAYVQQLMRTFQTNPSVAASSLLTRFLADTVSSARGKSELTPRAAQLLNSIVERLEPSRPVPRPVPLKAPAPSSSAAVAERKGPAKITLKPLVKTEEPARARRPRASARSSKASAQAVAVVVKARATASTAASTAKKVSAKPPKRKKPKRDMIDDDDEENEDGDFIVGEEGDKNFFFALFFFCQLISRSDPSAEDDGGDDDDDADERDLGDADDADDDDLGVEVDYDEVASSDDADSQSRGRHKAPVKKRATRPRPATRASAKQSGLSLTLPTALLPPKPAPKEEAYLDDNDILLFDAE